MERITVSSINPDPAKIAEAVEILRRGGVVAFATDTLYGLAVDPRRDDAVARLFAVKGRDEDTPVPLIASDLAQARQAGRFAELDLQLAQSFWPGPLTIVVPANPVVDRRILAGGNTIGIRVPAHEVARALCSSMEYCLTATSANLSGRSAAAAVSEIDPELLSRIDAVLDSGPAPGGPASTIVTTRSGHLELLRGGAIDWERVIKLLQ
jgi:L-threonylcarbamoyladenylate synthase